MTITRPPMGWNSWNTFAENIDEKLIMGRQEEPKEAKRTVPLAPRY